MDIDAAIEKLTEFKKLSKKLGECNLLSFDDNSFVVKVQFGEEDKPVERTKVLGFAEMKN